MDSMDNVREISSIRRTNRATSDARERFRYLNASHRSSGKSSNSKIYRRATKGKYGEYADTPTENENMSVNTDKSFRRLMLSTGFVAVVLAVKLMDNSFANKLESGVTNIIRNSSEFDNKISSKFVSLSDKMGININGINDVSEGNDLNNVGGLNDAININGQSESLDNVSKGVLGEDNLNSTGLNEQSKTEDITESKSDSEVISEDQVSDFYIDDSVFEEIKSKK